MSKDVWCQSCGQWYESDVEISECPFCYTFNYSGVEK